MNALVSQESSALERYMSEVKRIPKLSREDEDALARRFEATVQAHGFKGLSISLAHAELAGRLDMAHKDPFDRLLIAQSLIEGIALVSNETIFDRAGVSRIW